MDSYWVEMVDRIASAMALAAGRAVADGELCELLAADATLGRDPVGYCERVLVEMLTSR